MNCVLCTKLSKKWFLLHLNRRKLTINTLHFVVEHPVFDNVNFLKALIGRKHKKIGFKQTAAADARIKVISIISGVCIPDMFSH